MLTSFLFCLRSVCSKFSISEVWLVFIRQFEALHVSEFAVWKYRLTTYEKIHHSGLPSYSVNIFFSSIFLHLIPFPLFLFSLIQFSIEIKKKIKRLRIFHQFRYNKNWLSNFIKNKNLTREAIKNKNKVEMSWWKAKIHLHKKKIILCNIFHWNKIF